MLQGNIGQGHLRRDPFACIARRHTGEKVTGARRAGLSHHLGEAVETVGFTAYRMLKTGHCVSPKRRASAVAPARRCYLVTWLLDRGLGFTDGDEFFFRRTGHQVMAAVPGEE